MSASLTRSTQHNFASFRRQQLLLEYALLKHCCPEGIYVSLNPTDPALWTGIYFVREGAYAPAVLRFEISFPSAYPEVLPVVTFSSEIFHPLLVPLTTYTFSAGAIDASVTTSSSETERLPPGCLNLKHRFAEWSTAIPSRGRAASRNGEAIASGESDVATSMETTSTPDEEAISITATKPHISAILQYIKAAFEDAGLLDVLPLEAAGNQSAWHAWRSHRGLTRPISRSASPSKDTSSSRQPVSSRNPADWNWDGLWEARVRTGIDESTSDAQLFGSKSVRNVAAANDPIRFTRMDDEKLESIQNEMLKTYGVSSPAAAR